MFPPSVLENIYVRGSLKNNPEGFQLALRNNVDTGTLIGLGLLTVDGASFPPASLVLKTARSEKRGDQLGYSNSLYLPVGTDVQLRVLGQPLAPGAHHLVFVVNVAEIGRLQFEAADEVAA